MQIQISAEQLDAARKIAEPFMIPAAIWAYRRLKKKLNETITDNVNRIRDELKTYLDDKISAHESIELKYLQQVHAAVARMEQK